MLNDAAADDASYSAFNAGRRVWRSVCRFFACWNRAWISLMLLMAVFVPGLPFSRRLPVAKPSFLAPGLSRFSIVEFAFGPDSQTIATTDESGRTTIWQANDQWAPSPVLKFPGLAKVLDFSPSGRYVAVGGDNPHVAFWDLERASFEPSLDIPACSPSAIKFSPDGHTLAVASHDSPEIILWDISARRQRLTLRGHRAAVLRLSFAPDGRSLASATGTIADPRVLIWNVASGQPDRHIPLESAPLAIAFSSDNRLIATACPHETKVRIWDAGTGRPIRIIGGHAFSTRSVAFSPDTRLLMTGAGDGTVALWSVATGHELSRLDSHAEVVRNVRFSPDGKSLAATANDGEIRVWDFSDLTRKDILE
jgi:WD40 repeat protein